jgi:hypothetical protein
MRHLVIFAETPRITPCKCECHTGGEEVAQTQLSRHLHLVQACTLRNGIRRIRIWKEWDRTRVSLKHCHCKATAREEVSIGLLADLTNSSL